MYDRFRELEKPHSLRKRDVVLMATVTSFESLSNPSRTELRQFAELFRPLYENSTNEARRQAVAALSRCHTLPQPVCFFIGSQPIAVAAIFLAQSVAIDDRTLIDIARSQGAAHARAIATRDELSPIVVDALAALHEGAGWHQPPQAAPAPVTDFEQAEPTVSEATVAPAPDEVSEVSENLAAETAVLKDARDVARLAREEALREDLRHLIARNDPQRPVPKILKGASGYHQSLIVRFARNRETPVLARTLADALGSSIWLSDRIMLDITGVQLATTLVALGFSANDIRFVLCRVYPHLSKAIDGRTRAHLVLRSLDPAECVERVAAWRRADHYTETGEFEDDGTMPPDTYVRDGEASNQNAPLLSAFSQMKRG